MNLKDKLNRAYGLARDDKRAEKPTGEKTLPGQDVPKPNGASTRGSGAGRADSSPASGTAATGPAKKTGTRPAAPVTAGFRKQTVPAPEISADKPAKAWKASAPLFKSGLRGIEKAAKFLLLLGQEEAAGVLRHLKPSEIEDLSREIARIDHIDTNEANSILTEFGWLAQSSARDLQGGPQAAERMLAAAFGETRARELLLKAVPDSWKPFDFLNEFSAKQVLALLQDESSQVMSIILPHLDPKLASAVLAELNSPTRTEIVKRIARLDRMDSQVLSKVEEVLRDKLARTGRPETAQRIDGASVLAGILKHSGSDLEDSILSDLDTEHPELSEGIREQLFTVDDILRVPDREIQKGLKGLSERDIALILKGKSQEFKDKLLSNTSTSKRTIILEEYDILGMVRREDVQQATRDFVQYFKDRWDQGDLVLDGDEDLID